MTTIPGVGKNLLLVNVLSIPEASQLKAIVAALIQQIQGSMSGMLNAQSVSTGNGADTTDDTAYSFILPAGWLALLGTNSGLLVRFWGVSAANGNNKTFKLFFGTTTAISSGVVTINNKGWQASFEMLRSGTSTQTIIGSATSDATGIGTTVTAATEDETAAITIKGTLASGTTGAANDLVAKGWRVEVLQ